MTAPSATARSSANRSAENGTAKTTTARRARRLPRTASPLALYELMSGLALAGAFGIRKLRGR